MGQLRGKRVVVTGASRGIGSAIAQAFLEEGAEVIGVARGTAPDGDWTAHPQLHWQCADLSSAPEVARLFDAVRARWAGLDVLINNAGAQLAKSVEDCSEEDFTMLSNVNMRGVFLCCAQALPLMRAAGGGAIVNIGSIAGITPDYGLPLYSASKAWAHGFTKALAIEHGHEGIRCNALAPTWTRTELSLELFEEEVDPAYAENATNRRHPLGRMAEPEDIARAAVYLASAGASFINGQILAVDGGLGAASQINPTLDFQVG